MKIITLIFGLFATLMFANGISLAVFEGQYFIETSVFLGIAGIFIKMPSGSLAMSIAVQDSQGILTKGLVAVYKERPQVTSFLRSFFPSVESMTNTVSIAVERGSEYIAVDVKQYTDGNRNSFDSSTERLIKPPLYKEWLTVNEHRLYDQVIFAISQGQTTFFKEITADLATQLMRLRDKIERGIELQCSQVLESGVVQLTNNTDIDFKRKSASLVAYNVANDFTVGTVDPYRVLKEGATFTRTKGKSQGSIFNVIMGDDVVDAFLNNTIVKARADIRDFELDLIREPQRNSTGGVLHGRVSAGPYKFNIWSYPEYYDIPGGALNNPYLNTKKLVILPEKPNFITSFAAVPQLIGTDGTIPQSGAFLIEEFFNREKAYHRQRIQSAPIAIPVAIDQMYTIQVIAP